MLDRLIGRLEPLGAVIVHVDQRVSIEPFRASYPSATFIDDRVKVFYPYWSLTEASVRLLRHALDVEHAGRITLLRSEHYPIVPDSRLIELTESSDDWIAAFEAPDVSRGKPVSRFIYRSTRTRHHGSLGHRVHAGIRNRLYRPLDWTVALGEVPLRAGSAYWSLTAETARAVLSILDAGGPMVEYFRLISSPSESFFHTVVPLVSDSIQIQAISYSYWTGEQHPAELTMENVTGAMDDGRFFFAKKCTVSLADEIDAELLRRQRNRRDASGLSQRVGQQHQ